MSRKTDLTRAELIRQRNNQRNSKRQNIGKPRSYRAESLILPGAPRPARKQPVLRTPYLGGGPQLVARSSRNRRSEFAFTVADRSVRAPAISLPQINATRLSSGLLTLAIAFLLYSLWTSSMFMITSAEVYGNQRLGLMEINAGLRLVGQTIFKAVPEQIEANLLSDYPDLATVDVEVAFPNRVIVTLTERTPVIFWDQDGVISWIDADGVAFPQRGEAAGLITVLASGSPPPVRNAAGTLGLTPVFLDPAMVQAMATLYPYIPAGTPMVYDPKYGLGWQDGRGWSVYFGQNTNDITMKIQVYQAIVDRLTGLGITPTMISVEYLQAPFYK